MSCFKVFRELHRKQFQSMNSSIEDRKYWILWGKIWLFTAMFNILLFTLQMYFEQFYSDLNNINLNLINKFHVWSNCFRVCNWHLSGNQSAFTQLMAPKRDTTRIWFIGGRYASTSLHVTFTHDSPRNIMTQRC